MSNPKVVSHCSACAANAGSYDMKSVNSELNTKAESDPTASKGQKPAPSDDPADQVGGYVSNLSNLQKK